MSTTMDIPELLLAVLGYLDGKSLSMCSQVCKRWHEPASDLMWARVQTLEYVISKFIPERLLVCFREPVFRYINYKEHPEMLEPVPTEPTAQGQNTEPTDVSNLARYNVFLN